MSKDKKGPGGAPTVFTQEVIQKLEYSFAMGCSDKEACLYANISPASLYNYQKSCPEFLERKEMLKETPILLARQEVLKGLKGNGELALRFLERRKKDEFGTNISVGLSGNLDLTHHEKKAAEMTDEELMAALAQKKA